LAGIRADEKFDALPDERAVSGVSAFLTVQEGCDKFCSFCVGALYARRGIFAAGRSHRRGSRAAGGKGVREITCSARTSTPMRAASPPDPGPAKIEGLGRIRYTTSHPRDMDGS